MFNEQEIAVKSGYVTVYCWTPSNGEYTGAKREYINQGTGLSPCMCLDRPLDNKEGFAIVRKNNQWEYVEDHRLTKVYHQETQEPSYYPELGAILDPYTEQAPTSPYCVFKEGRWVEDKEKMQLYLEEKKKQYVQDVDDTCAAFMNKWTRFQLEYQNREHEALVYKEAGYTGQVGEYVQDFINVSGMSAKDAVDLILSQAHLLKVGLKKLSSIRMRKFQLLHAQTIEQLEDIYAQIQEQIKQLSKEVK